MNVRHAYVAFCALFALFFATLAGCTDAGKCERGDEGCACRVPVDERDRCNSGLGCQDGFCAVDSGGDGDGPRDAGERPDVDCEGATIAESCAAFCELFCYNQIRFCGASECTPADCEAGGGVLEICGECTTLSCATQLCSNQAAADLSCDDFGVEVVVEGERRYETMCIAQDPMCVQKHSIGCSDVCGSSDDGTNGEYVGNDICEDGDEMSESTICDRGTDCTDCGPHPCKQAGVVCQNHGDCCGFYGLGALCVDPDDDETGPKPLPPVCSPFCDGTAGSCPENFDCRLTTTDKRVCVPKKP